MIVNGKITLELEVSYGEDGGTQTPKVTVEGITKEQLYWLFEGGDLMQDLGMYVYDHMDEMPDEG
jgi:hypothetical protein